ncbi:putative pinene synthase [Ziziphus jujuba]|uniref:Pinene synthase n=1 Tax=Ziziphus jujuba TaxID=326968 RepID=A0ABM3I7I8_ZIZJJ|nr:putative pinene synthase [Ziziphus jujuba]
MSIQQVSALTQNNKRRFADFDPSVWGDYFLSHSSTETVPIDAMREQVEELKEEVKELLLDSQKQPLQKLELIESIQRLGVAYHFEREIGGILENMHHSYSDGFFDGEHGHEHDDLYEVALCFRLLRQHRYYISCGMVSL